MSTLRVDRKWPLISTGGSTLQWRFDVPCTMCCRYRRKQTTLIRTYGESLFPGLPWIWISMDISMDIHVSMCGYQT